MKNYTKILSCYSSGELIEAMLQYVANRKKNDKGDIAYKIGMIDHWQGLCSSNLKRSECIERFKSLLNEKTIYMVIQSEYTASQLLNFLPKK
jgi:hypothetical protein